MAICSLARVSLRIGVVGAVIFGIPLVGSISQQVNLAEEGLHNTRLEAVEPFTMDDHEFEEPGC